MAGLDNTFKRISSKDTLKKRVAPNPFKEDQVKEGFGNPIEVLEEGAKDLTEAFTPVIPEPEEQAVIPIPDGRKSKVQARKRRARAKASGRSGTILTEGLGG